MADSIVEIASDMAAVVYHIVALDKKPDQHTDE